LAAVVGRRLLPRGWFSAFREHASLPVT
jgi:hypothetical protein